MTSQAARPGAARPGTSLTAVRATGLVEAVAGPARLPGRPG